METKDCSVPYSFHILIILLHSSAVLLRQGSYTLCGRIRYLCSHKVCELCPQIKFSEINYRTPFVQTCTPVWLVYCYCISMCVPVGRCIHVHCVFMHYFVCTGHLAVQSINIWDLWNQVCSGESTLSVSLEKPGHTCICGVGWSTLTECHQLHASQCLTLSTCVCFFSAVCLMLVDNELKGESGYNVLTVCWIVCTIL